MWCIITTPSILIRICAYGYIVIRCCIAKCVLYEKFSLLTQKTVYASVVNSFRRFGFRRLMLMIVKGYLFSKYVQEISPTVFPLSISSVSGIFRLFSFEIFLWHRFSSWDSYSQISESPVSKSSNDYCQDIVHWILASKSESGLDDQAW
jgi:hypothetical protein